MSKKIAIAGKGGTGKSTIAALMIAQLCKNNSGPILAIDADPDANLGTLLGVDVLQTLGDLRDDLLKEMIDLPPGMSKINYIEAGLHQVIIESNGFDLLTMGKGEDPGCYCFLNNLIKKFSDSLMNAYPWTVIDNEAGLEHISRRTSGDIDALIIVVTDNPVSISTAKKIEEVAAKIKTNIRDQFLVTNMIRDQHREKTLQKLSQLQTRHICSIPSDPLIEEMSYEGNFAGNISSPIVKESIEQIINEIGENYGTS